MTNKLNSQALQNNADILEQIKDVDAQIEALPEAPTYPEGLKWTNEQAEELNALMPLHAPIRAGEFQSPYHAHVHAVVHSTWKDAPVRLRAYQDELRTKLINVHEHYMEVDGQEIYADFIGTHKTTTKVAKAMNLGSASNYRFNKAVGAFQQTTDAPSTAYKVDLIELVAQAVSTSAFV